MMLGVSALIDTAADTHESGGGSGGSSEVGASSSAPAGGVEENERIGGGGGNRWPRQETLSLLKIRSDMDVTFRDASLKGPLWEEVSRKMAELGFQRSAKKCKEKFENVFKYHKRTKDGRATKPDGKSYRFFDQLEALENTSPNNHFTPPPPLRPQPSSSPAPPPPQQHVITSTFPSASPVPLTIVLPTINANPINSSSAFQHQLNSSAPHSYPPHPHPHPLSNSTSSSTSSDEDIQRRGRGRKRKWKDYFEKLMTEVVQKQEELQKKFLEALERRERDRIGREEAWRVQEMARLNHEHDLLVHERSIAAAKDAAVISFLQKVTGQTEVPQTTTQQPPMQQLQPPPQSNPPAPPEPQPQPQPPVAATQPKMLEITPSRDNGGGDDHVSAGSSRWPKAEVEALIKLRTDLDTKYQENGPKGPLWEEISKAMTGLGYRRSSKRCKEKWENINKYFKKVKESNKKRPEDSKTCPYFHQLDAIYKERAKNNIQASFKPDNAMAPIMARPEQQWPQQPQQPLTHDNESENHEEDDDEEDEDEEDEVGEYEMIANKQPSTMTNTVE